MCKTDPEARIPSLLPSVKAVIVTLHCNPPSRNWKNIAIDAFISAPGLQSPHRHRQNPSPASLQRDPFLLRHLRDNFILLPFERSSG